MCDEHPRGELSAYRPRLVSLLFFDKFTVLKLADHHEDVQGDHSQLRLSFQRTDVIGNGVRGANQALLGLVLTPLQDLFVLDVEHEGAKNGVILKQADIGSTGLVLQAESDTAQTLNPELVQLIALTLEQVFDKGDR
mmetsp:Transcript_30413/g.40446  ORF Transcript_30413/g.40446 Transcript_30413/m.40446 type:complete len:137 (-) Transcript_30413:1177-1587(-)